jgi:hypothetical protein
MPDNLTARKLQAHIKYILRCLKCSPCLLSPASHYLSSFVEIPVLFSLIAFGNKSRKIMLLPKAIHLPTGHRVLVPSDDLTGFLSSFYDIFINCEYFANKSFFSRKDQVIVDASAYMGFFALRALDFCNNRCSVVAVEPGPDNFSILLSNIRLF